MSYVFNNSVEVPLEDFNIDMPHVSVVVDYDITVQPAEPDVGYFSPYVEEVTVTNVQFLMAGLITGNKIKTISKKKLKTIENYIHTNYSDDAIDDFLLGQ